MKYFRDRRTAERARELINSAEGTSRTVYDIETKSLEANPADILQFVGRKSVLTGGKWELKKEINILIKPNEPIPPEITKINHIDNDMVADKPRLPDIWWQISDIMDADFWIGHNIIGFDNHFLKLCYERFGEPLPKGYYNSFDTLDAVTDLVDHNDCGKYNLGSMCSYFGIDENTEGTSGYHDALFDVRQDEALCDVLLNLYAETEIPKQRGYINKDIVPTIKSVKSWKAFPKAYKTGNYFFIETDCGKFRYDKYQQIWTGVPFRPVDWQKVLEATYAFCGVDCDSSFLRYPG